ncbi:pentatricopeptide repeat-containing protein At5g67570, chloroplastic-like isoform X1 [Phoenix dactylifera]|uniref:Pentatricopeptide repeat-containing protein At5g67570, chloroplastic-like isoform X1 n=1 Tax=Phoenix dactylifera TaxID=42345 RepID=A0A8B8ZWP1_PHODC|nr:pentatricopeptide repeat-containing protein At5g67570, chloroplastic-like isoform X1 [Phoenix dactylifera]
MEASLASPSALMPTLLPRSEGKKSFEPNTEAIKQRLLRKGVFPTPKILHAIRKKEIQKALRRDKKEALKDEPLPLSASQRQALEEEAHFRTVSAEYRAVREELRRRNEKALALAGKPWERSDKVDLRGLMSLKEECGEGRLKGEHLVELREMLAERNGERFRWLLDDDVEEVGGVVDKREMKQVPWKQNLGDEEKIQLLIKRLSSTDLNLHDWKFSRLMKQSGLFFTEMHLLKILEGLGALGNWSQALSVVEWVHNQKRYKHRKSRFVYTKLLAVLGKARKPSEALRIFNVMREDGQIYPDMAAYHSIAVTLGQAGLLNELMTIVECMRQKPSKRIKNMNRRNWDPCLEPDIVIYNAVLNACIPSHQWKGVFWVLEQIRFSGLKPTGATFGLAMEVMLRAGKHNFVHNFFEKMQKSGLPPKALTYKVIVRTFWEEGKVDEAVEAIRDMEKRGVVGAACVYYELACCLCNNGRWKDAMMEVEKLKSLPLTKPLEVAFTGMILSSLDGGYIYDCISIFEHMKDHCAPNIGTVNAMLKVYGHSDMFAKAKELFEATKATVSSFKSYTGNDSSLELDAYSYSSMLEASASAHQWEYFEYVYKEMALCGYQLDQRKHAWLLVEASRHGKWHLLEHAFDMILEAGEIPHVSLFTEMICQTIGQQNFKSTVSLINGMAYASLKVSEIQWLNLFQINMDRFSKDKLCDLLNHISSCDLVIEDPVPNFLKALQSFCGMKLLDTTVLTDTSDVSAVTPAVTGNDEGDNNCDEIQAHIPGKMLMDDDGSPLCSQEDSLMSERPLDRTEGSHSMSISLQERVNNVASSSFAGNEGNELHSVFHGYTETPITDAALNSLTADTGRPFSELPSASEILETWKQDRLKDGIFPFQC